MHALALEPALAVIRKPKPPSSEGMVNIGLYIDRLLLTEVDAVKLDEGHRFRNPVLVDLIRGGLKFRELEKAAPEQLNRLLALIAKPRKP